MMLDSNSPVGNRDKHSNQQRGCRCLEHRLKAQMRQLECINLVTLQIVSVSMRSQCNSNLLYTIQLYH